MKKRLWQEPVVTSIDQCQPIFGACGVGSTPGATGPLICSPGAGGKAAINCDRGNGANIKCTAGNGAKAK